MESTNACIQQNTNQVYKPFLSALLTNLDDRFPDIEFIESFTVLDPSPFPHDDLAALNQHGNDKIDALVDHYDGFPQLNKTETKREWQLYKHRVVSDQHLTDKTAIEMTKLLSRRPHGSVSPKSGRVGRVNGEPHCVRGFADSERERGFLQRRRH